LSDRKRLGIIILFNIGLALYATPVIDMGDANAYIKFSRSFFEEIPENFAHRSPLYSLLLAGMMTFFKPPLVYTIMVLLHYVLVSITTWMVYRLFNRVLPNRNYAFLAALLFNVSFATIFYANLIQTEILTVFFLVLSLTLLVIINEKGVGMYIFLYSLVIGFLALTR
jgi:4-amino-4-deoxy-L-arabinose transferase-like glycosyltransferase